jgi:predicted DNA-binding antitoxin AbrB/MazE fold protein
MVLHFQATYEDGVLRPSVPLALPDRTRVEVTVVAADEVLGKEAENEVEDEEVRPAAPRLTVEEFRRILANRGPGVGTLPIDFDRHDIYSDHD